MGWGEWSGVGRKAWFVYRNHSENIGKRTFPGFYSLHFSVVTFAPSLGFFYLNYSLLLTTVSHLFKLQVCILSLTGATLREPGGEESSPQDNDLERGPSVCLLKNLEIDHSEAEPCLWSSLCCVLLVLGLFTCWFIDLCQTVRMPLCAKTGFEVPSH